MSAQASLAQIVFRGSTTTKDPAFPRGAALEDILYDPAEKKVVPEVPSKFLGLGRSEVYPYRIVLNHPVTFQFGPINVPSRCKEEKLPIRVRYEITASQGATNPDRLVEFVARNAPERIHEADPLLEEHVLTAMKKFRDTLPKSRDLVTDFSRLRSRWEDHIEEQVREETALRIVVTLDAGAEMIPVHAYVTPKTDVRVEGYDYSIPFEARVDLEIDPDKRLRARAFAGRVEELTNEIRESVRSYLSHHCSIDDIFWTERRERVQSTLEEWLGDITQKHGRRALHFRLTFYFPFDPPKLDSPIPVRHDYDIKEWGAVKIHHSVELTLVDLGQYLRLESQHGSVEAYVKEQAVTATKRVLFNKHYVDIATCFPSSTIVDSAPADDPSLEGKIREQVRNALAQYGLEVRQYSSMPEIAAIKLLRDGFVHQADIKCTTRSRDVKVRLEISVDGRLANLDRLRDDFKPGVDVVGDVIFRRGVDAVKRKLLSVSPQRFFYRYESPHHSSAEPHYSGDAGSVEEELKTAFVAALKERFGVNECEVIINKLNTPLDDRYKRLLQPFRAPEVVVAPNDGGPDQIFVVNYFVVMVPPGYWDQFMKLDGVYNTAEEELERVDDCICRVASSLLNLQWSSEALRFRNAKHRTKIQEKVLNDPNVGVVATVLQQYGLAIEVILDRKADALESAQQDVRMAKLDHHQKVESLQYERDFERLELTWNKERELRADSGAELDEVDEFKDAYDKQFADLKEDLGYEESLSVRNQSLTKGLELDWDEDLIPDEMKRPRLPDESNSENTGQSDDDTGSEQ